MPAFNNCVICGRTISVLRNAVRNDPVCIKALFRQANSEWSPSRSVYDGLRRADTYALAGVAQDFEDDYTEDSRP